MAEERRKRNDWAFNELSDKNAQSWNTMLSAYSQKGLFEKTFQMLDVMPDPNAVSYNSIISSLTHHGLGALNLLCELHGLATVIGVRFNLVVCNALIDAYGKCGKPGYSYSIFCQMRETDVFSWTSLLVAYIRASRMPDVCSLFDHMRIRNVVAWTALITGFAQNGEGDKALCTFKEMLEEGIVPRASTYVGVLSSCAGIPLIEKDMISAMRLFERLDEKDRVTWNSIINGFAQNGNGVMSLFMERKYDIVTQLDHYAILIDLLGRKNMHGEAADLIKRAPWGRDNIGMWGALLDACRVHGNLKLARRVAENLFELEPDNAARYIMLSNIYAAAGMWGDARTLRRYIYDRGLVKETTYSWIEINNIRHKFIAKDKSHSQLEEIKELLLKLVDPMKDAGYIFQIKCSYFLVDDAFC
ncbi:pentatricopeptide repeat-containing protein At2g13600-like [Nicotiana sylvestris]|uniref:pentatricopeptide repeat-containing protein At2g13600-like n=1 Tax=Nicotiana sylvestris TaxID=4096 RepID=UPI00388C99E5